MRHPLPRLVPVAAIAALLLLTLLASTPASARESRTLGDRWNVTIGFIDEPAIQADTNGLWLRITEGDQPVEGLEQSLQAEVIYGDAVRALPLIPAIDEPGTYTSTFIPVQPGDYTFRIFGTIGDLALDERFTSAPEGVAIVDSRTNYEFPTAAQGWAPETLAMPVALGGILLGLGIARFVSHRGSSQTG
jgi:hypothetical protein